jgi:PPOX class probable F420-dependent enzyme
VSDLDERLVWALERLSAPGRWATLATLGSDGWPHATPVLAGVVDTSLVASVTGRQKQRNLARDPRAALVFAIDGSMAHVVVWGRMALRDDEAATEQWRSLLRAGLGEEGLAEWDRPLGAGGTLLGVMEPTRWRIFGLEPAPPG